MTARLPVSIAPGLVIAAGCSGEAFAVAHGDADFGFFGESGCVLRGCEAYENRFGRSSRQPSSGTPDTPGQEVPRSITT